jgi:uncharacterized protein (TIGR02117 family)
MLSRRAAILAFALLALQFGGPAARGQATPKSACPTVYVIDHGWHTGIVVPARDFAPRAYFREKQFRDWRWLKFGWGDAAFYQTPDAGLGLALRALLTPTDTVMHVIGFNSRPARAYPTRETLALKLSPSGYRKVLSYIKGSFALGEDGRPTLSKDGKDGRSGYFKALGSYSILRTCNTWLAQALVKGGLPLDPDDAARAEDLMAQLRALRWNGCTATREAPEPAEE